MSMYVSDPRKTSRSLILMKNTTDSRKQIYPDYLVHYGIFGQKWGVRRYQNEDGTLTEEGKQRYNQKPESEEWKKSDAEHLSDDELRRRNNRLQAERQYKDLTTSQVERERIQRRKDIINKVIVGTAVSLAAVAMRGRWKQAASFIGKFGKRSLAKIRTKLSMGNVIRRGAKPYTTGVGTNVRNNSDMFNRGFDAWKDVRKYNYRPRINNSLPKSRSWPRL